MSVIDNLNRGEIADLVRRVRALENRTTLNNAAIGRAGMEVYDGGVINVSNGNLLVNGTATISGVLNADGTVTLSGIVRVSGPLTITGDTSVSGDFTVTGPTTLNGQTDIGGDTTVTGDLDVEGPLTVTGDTKLDGKTDISGDTTMDGTLDIKGKSTLQNDLEVKNGGKVKVGGMTLGPSKNGGELNFSNGALLRSAASAVLLRGPGGANVLLSDDIAQIGGPKGVIVDGPLHNPGFSTASGKEPNVYMDSNGNLSRII